MTHKENTMKSNHKIKVNIEIVECFDETQLEPHQQKDGPERICDFRRTWM